MDQTQITNSDARCPFLEYLANTPPPPHPEPKKRLLSKNASYGEGIGTSWDGNSSFTETGRDAKLRI